MRKTGASEAGVGERTGECRSPRRDDFTNHKPGAVKLPHKIQQSIITAVRRLLALPLVREPRHVAVVIMQAAQLEPGVADALRQGDDLCAALLLDAGGSVRRFTFGDVSLEP